MLDPRVQTIASALPVQPASPRPIFKMITSDRMAGSVPAWVMPGSAKDQTVAALGTSETQGNGSGRFADDLHNAAMSYAPAQGDGNTMASGGNTDKPFGFSDLVDIVNPLQHIPIVSNLYRAITGDKIRPSSEIVGDAIYGGVAGAASSLANVIVEKETGKDIMGHAVALVEGPDTQAGTADASAQSVAAVAPAAGGDNPVTRLAQAENDSGLPPDLPGSALAFADLGARHVTPMPAKPERWAAVYRFND